MSGQVWFGESCGSRLVCSGRISAASCNLTEAAAAADGSDLAPDLGQ